VFDGGPAYDYSSHGSIIAGLNDLEWNWIDDINGATMMPTQPKVPDINKWEEYISFPDLDEWDWETLREQNATYLGTNKLNTLGIQCGLWERLMAMMDVVEACIAMYDDDLKPGVHRFFDVYSDWIIDYIGRVKDVCDINSVVLHEDWAHQLGPFFSPDVAREMLLPYIQKIVNYVHSRGMAYEIHCCGACELLIPVFIETGADMWGGQTDLNDMGGYAKQYKGSHLIFGVPSPDLPPEASEAEAKEAARAWVDEYKDCRVSVGGMRPMAAGLAQPNPFMNNAIYECSRLAFENED
jgi:hypothetical protein